jgi:hypothetical protein
MMHKDCFPEKGWQVLASLKSVICKYNAILAGGTALAFQLGHRISYDLDLFTDIDFRVESVISDIRKTGLPFQIVSEGAGYITADVNGIKFSLFEYEYPFLEKPLILKGIKVAGILDISSMKVIAISQRGTKRDFSDLYCVLQDIPFHKISRHMFLRFGKERINPIHIGKSLVYFSDADSNPEPNYLESNILDWEMIRKFYRNHVRQFVLDLETAGKEI